MLDDPRSWAGFGNNNFRLVADPEQAKLTITIASPATTDALCGPSARTQGLYSCRRGVCGTCETTVLQGDPDHRDMVLTPDERESNQTMMICVSRARGGELVLDI